MQARLSNNFLEVGCNHLEWRGGTGTVHRQFNSFKLRYAVQRTKIRTTRFNQTGRDSGKSPLLSGQISSRCRVIASVKITLSCNIFLPNAFKQDGSTFRLRCDLLAVIVSAGRLRPPPCGQIPGIAGRFSVQCFEDAMLMERCMMHWFTGCSSQSGDASSF